ncbi:MAG: alanine racemase [Pseudomonadota bacterium]
MLVRAKATIDPSAIVSNWKALHSIAGSAEIAAVVKANAYGHGVAEICPRLHGAGCRTFFTATVEEAVSVRNAVGPDVTVYVLNGVMGGDIPRAVANDLIPIINSLPQLKDWLASDLSTGTGAVLHVDTGMNRLGLSAGDINTASVLLDKSPVAMVMSHLACADEVDHPMNEEQRRRFVEIAHAWPEAKRSLSNSAGLGLGDYGFDLVRPGIALYGGGVQLPTSAALQPAMTLEAPVLSVFDVPEGASTGYGATRHFDTPRRLATIGIGYADGLLRSLSNSGFAYIEGERCDIVGRISMDLTTLDVTAISCMVTPGMAAEFIGSHADLEAQAKAAGTLGYELLTGIGPRVERVWHG